MVMNAPSPEMDIAGIDSVHNRIASSVIIDSPCGSMPVSIMAMKNPPTNTAVDALNAFAEVFFFSGTGA